MHRTLVLWTLMSCLQVKDRSNEADADTDADADSDADVDSVYALQQGSIAEGSTVDLGDVVVTGGNTAGAFVQDRAGGPYSGVWVYYAGERPSPLPTVGARVRLSGVYEEYEELTQITLTPGSWEPDGTGTVTASVIEPAELSSVPEAWEGVLVTVERALGPLSGSGGQPGRFTIDSGIVVQDWFYDWTDDHGELGSGSRFERITGVLDHRLGEFRLLPREASDLEVL